LVKILEKLEVISQQGFILQKFIERMCSKMWTLTRWMT